MDNFYRVILMALLLLITADAGRAQVVSDRKCKRFAEFLKTGKPAPKLKDVDDSVAVLSCIELALSDTIADQESRVGNLLRIADRVVRPNSGMPVKLAAVSVYTKVLNRRLYGHTHYALNRLMRFERACFAPAAIDRIAAYLKEKQAGLRGIALLAGSLNVPLLRDELLAKLQTERLRGPDRWVVHLALARMGNTESVTFLRMRADAVALCSNVVEHLYPDLLYTRRKELIDLMVEQLFTDERLCESANPDSEAMVNCGYRILEMLAPVIEGFPIGILPSGDLDVASYKEALLTAREWFRQNKMNYSIKDS